MKSGPYLLMHREMFYKFAAWVDRACELEHGYKLSELQRIESQIARLSVLEDPSPAAVAELAQLKDAYKKVWVERRRALG